MYKYGNKNTFKYKNEQFNSLIKEYSNDGGHLNDLGSYLAARELLQVLIGISSDGSQ